MNINDFVSKPTIKTLTIDSEEILKEYGEPIEFNILLPIPIEDYASLTKLTTADFVAKMLVDKDGQKVLTEGKSLSLFLLSPIKDKIWLELGKLPEKCLTQNPSQSI